MTAAVAEIARLFRVREGAGLNLPSFEAIYPNRRAPVVRGPTEARQLAMMTWGFPPPHKAGARPVTNVRNLDSPFWRSALQNPERRYLVPVTAFCEWEGETGAKRKVWFELTDTPLFAFAGVWRPAEGGERFAFLTCEPNATVAAVHPKAMPAILDPKAADAWLDADGGEHGREAGGE